MKKDLIFKEGTLFSQEEIAMLLGITRSQWAMFEIGQRDIPGSAKVKLANLLRISKEMTTVTKAVLAHRKEQETKKQAIIEKYIKDSQFKQMQLERTLERMNRKYKEAENTLHLIAYMKEQSGFTESDHMVLESVVAKAHLIIKQNGLDVQVKQQLKLDGIKGFLGLLGEV